MVRVQSAHAASGELQCSTRSESLSGDTLGRLGFGFRLLLALLLIGAAFACGGGGGASSGKVRVGARLSTSSLTFASQLLRTASTVQTVTVTSTGILDLSFASVVIAGSNSGDFTKVSDTCSGAAILPNGSCSVGIAYNPSANGSSTATLQFNDNAPASPQTVSLSGNGIGPAASFSPAAISFGPQPLGVASPVQTETITNSGPGNLNISTVTLGGGNAGGFTKMADTCTAATLATNASCTIGLTFNPPNGGTFSAMLVVADNASDSPQSVNVTGIGDAPAASFSPTILAFSDQNLGTTSPTTVLNVTNTGAENLVISTVALTGANASDFTKTGDNCAGTTLAPTRGCTVTMTFAPAASGLRNASLTFADNAFDSPQVVGVTGNGTIPVAGVAPSSLTFTHQNQGTTSTARTVVVTNSGTGKMTIASVALGGPGAAAFSKVIDTCTGAAITTANSCAVTVTFTPSSATNFAAALNFTDDASNNPQSVSLAGTGTAPAVTLSSPGLAFASQNVGTVGASQSVIVTNTGTANLAISTVPIGGTNSSDFAKNSDGCTGAIVMPAEQCVVSVTFKPAAAGVRAAALNITDNAPGGPTSVTLGGTGVAPAVALTPPNAAVAPTGTIQFAAATGGTATNAVTWSVNGIAGGSPTLGTIGASGLYTAPAASSAQVVTVQATLTSDTSLVGSAAVAIVPPGTVSTTKNPQVALYSISVPEASSVAVQFGPDTNYGLSTSAQSTPPTGGQAQVLVAGMRGNTTYHMRAVVRLLDGTEFDDLDQVFTTGGLSAGQTPAITTSTGTSPNGGIEMLNLVNATPTATAETAVATDLSGNVIWYFDPQSALLYPNPTKLLPDGNLLLNFNTQGADGINSLLEEVDLAGNVIWRMTAADLNAALANAGYTFTIVGTHHDVAVLPNGHLIVIASQVQNFTDLPGYPGTTAVAGDVLIDLDPSRKPVWVWSEFDHLDVNRHPMAFPDWTHTNAVVYSPSDGNLMISIRHQHWLVKIDYNNGQGNGDIVWKLGWQGDFTLVGGTDPIDWFYAQHGPSFVDGTSSGRFQLALFDNGDNRPSAVTAGTPCGSDFNSACYSRVPVFDIDEAALTATIHWQDTLNFFSFFGGNAEALSNGNIEFDASAAGGNSPAARASEVTPDSSPQTVWQMNVTGQYAYRAMRIPSLYPGVQW